MEPLPSPLGLENDAVRLLPWQPAWAEIFAAERARLLGALGDSVLDIQHVGSTSIPGMPAKPIIDIGIAVQDFDAAVVCVAPIVALGYEYRGENGIPRRHYFVRGAPRLFHVHMNEIHGRDWQEQLRFRDTLIADPALAAEYAALKQELARRFPHERGAYLEGKAPFIRRVLGLPADPSPAAAGTAR